MNNTEFADVLQRLAEHYRADEGLKQIFLYGGLNTKEELRHTLKSLGGKWVKSGLNDTSEYADIKFKSDRFGPLLITISRNAVCRKIVRYECDPIMSPEEEAEILQEEVAP